MKYLEYALGAVGGFAFGLMCTRATGAWEIAATVFAASVLLRLPYRTNLP